MNIDYLKNFAYMKKSDFSKDKIKNSLKKTLFALSIKGKITIPEFFIFFSFYLFSLLLLQVFFMISGMNDFVVALDSLSAENISSSNIPRVDNKLIICFFIWVIPKLYLEILVFFNLSKRLHDAGKSAWYFLFVMIAGWVSSIFFLAPFLAIIILALLPQDKNSEY